MHNMKTLLKFTLLAYLLMAGTLNLSAAPAGAGHSHEKMEETKAVEIAKSMKNGLVKKGTIANSWGTAGVSNTEKKRFGNNDEWVVSFDNPQIEDKSKQTLYVFISLTGEVTGANYTGK